MCLISAGRTKAEHTNIELLISFVVQFTEPLGIQYLELLLIYRLVTVNISCGNVNKCWWYWAEYFHWVTFCLSLSYIPKKFVADYIRMYLVVVYNAWCGHFRFRPAWHVHETSSENSNKCCSKRTFLYQTIQSLLTLMKLCWPWRIYYMRNSFRNRHSSVLWIGSVLVNADAARILSYHVHHFDTPLPTKGSKFVYMLFSAPFPRFACWRNSVYSKADRTT